MLSTAVLLTNTPSIKVNGVSITEIVTSLTLTESLFDPVLRGRFSTFTAPSVNVQQLTGCVGQLCPIDFSFHSLNNLSQEKEIKAKDFFIYKIVPSGEEPGSANKTIIYYFASKGIFENTTKLISKFYEDTISNIVNSLCKEINITCNTTSTKGKLKRVLPYDTAFAHIINLSKQAISEENPKDSDFVFYQDIDHQYHFKPISTFKKKEVKWKYKLFNPSGESSVSDVKYSIIKETTEQYSPVDNALQGLYSSEIISFDTTTGEYFSKTHVNKPNKYTTVSGTPLFNVEESNQFKKIANSGTAVRKFNKQRFLHDCSEPPEGQDGVGLENDWVGNRMSSMQQNDQVVIYLNVPGNSEMKVGDIIEVRKPLNENYINQDQQQKKEKDIMSTGKYLITIISHDIVYKQSEENKISATYTMRIKAIKDSKGGEYA